MGPRSIHTPGPLVRTPFAERIQLIDEIDGGRQAILEELLEAWKIPKAKEGKIPRDQQPNTSLLVPLVCPSQSDNGATSIPIFLGKLAVEAFLKMHNVQGVIYRAVTPTRLEGTEHGGFLLAFEPSMMKNPSRVEVWTHSQGNLKLANTMTFDPNNHPGPYPNLLNIVVQGLGPKSAYVLIMEPRAAAA